MTESDWRALMVAAQSGNAEIYRRLLTEVSAWRYKWIDRLRAMKAASLEALSDDLAVLDHGNAVQDARSLELLLDRLKPAQAEVIRLVKLQGFSLEEAASRTGQTVSLVKVNIHRGLGRLTALVQDQTDAP